MPKKVANTAALRKAKADHEKFLTRLGVNTKKPKLSGVVADPLAATGLQRDACQAPTSDHIPTSGTARKANPRVDLPIAQVYHKGPLMVVTDMKHLAGSKRRD